MQPTILVCNNRPGKLFIHGAKPLNKSSDSRVRYKISPIQIKSGNAVRDQLDAVLQMVVIIASPAGLLVNNSKPTKATPMRAKPIQTPVPSKKNSVKRNIPVKSKFSINLLPYHLSFLFLNNQQI